jgi:regulator of protease activity HflC (stomatin/prohibitin superfamily)
MLDLVLLFVAVLVIIFLLVISHLRIVPESEAWVMERLGVYSRTWHTGLHLKVPFVEKKRGEPIDLREQILVVGEGYNHNHYHNHTMVKEYEKTKYGFAFKREDVTGHNGKSQPVITKDNVSMEIDTVVFYQITDPKLFVYGHKTPIAAIEHLAATTLRNLVGELELDETLSSRDTINAKLRVVLDEATDAWGIKVTRVELKNIIVSDKELAEAMEKQMIAERTRRANVIEAEGIRKSAILVAEGKKQAAILEAEGAKQAVILAAEAKREADICEGQGEAERIILVEQATAEGIKLINASAPSTEVLTIKSLEAFEEAAKGQSNTIIIPSEIQGLAGLAKSASEVFKA